MTTELTAFLRAIKADPDDDNPRLLLADWLEEGGQAERADLIRSQCELARLDRANDSGPRQAYLKQAVQSLVEHHRNEWLAPYRKLFRVSQFNQSVSASGWLEGPWFDRGMVHLRMSLEHVFEHLTALTDDPIALEWVEGLAAISRHGGEITRLGDAALLRSIAHLSLYDQRELNRTADVEIEALANSPHVNELRRLTMALSLGEVAAQHLANSPRLNRLTSLNLRYNPIGDVGVSALAGSRNMSHLRHLNLEACDVGNRGLTALLESHHLQHLTALDLRKNRINDVGVQAVLQSRWVNELVHLDIGNNHISTYWRRELRRAFQKRVYTI